MAVPALAWDSPQLTSDRTLALTSPDFDHEGTLPHVHAATRAGGRNLSPALVWSPAPDDTAQLLVVIEDPDAPTRQPFIHCVALLEPSVTDLARGALGSPSPGVRLLRSGIGSGYFGPAPPRSHGPHRYVFQLFALATETPGKSLETAGPRDVLARAGNVLARGRLDGFYKAPAKPPSAQ